MPHDQTERCPHATGATRVGCSNLTHLLVAEDNRLNSLLLREQLRLIGYSAEFVISGSDALMRWRQAEFAALLTDIQMPGMDGYELASRIRDEQGDRVRMPIIVLTANSLHDSSARWRAAGVDAYLVKPAELATLKQTLAQWIGTGSGAIAFPVRPPLVNGAGSPVDLTVLSLSIGDDLAVLAEIVDAFSASAVNAAQGIDIAVASGDTRRVDALAHQLKSSARSIGAVALGERCDALEAAADGGDEAELRSSCKAFQAEAAAVLHWLAAHPVAVPPGRERSVP